MSEKGVVLILSGLAWCVGHHYGWDGGITHVIGIVFWLVLLFGGD